MFNCKIKTGSNEMPEEKLNELESNLFPIEFEIVKELFGRTVDGYVENRNKEWESTEFWTKKVKETFYNIGQSHGYGVCPYEENGKFKREWLFDMVWFKLKATADKEKYETGKWAWADTEGLKMVCESEWLYSHPEAIVDDFLKLTVADAGLRVFIYTNTMINEKHPVDICKSLCPLSKGYQYLLIGFPRYVEQNKYNFRIDSWVA